MAETKRSLFLIREVIRMSKLVELRLRKEALQKKMDQVEAELELVYHLIDAELEEQLDN